MDWTTNLAEHKQNLDNLVHAGRLFETKHTIQSLK